MPEITTDAEALAVYRERFAGRDGWPEVPIIKDLSILEEPSRADALVIGALTTRIEMHLGMTRGWWIEYDSDLEDWGVFRRDGSYEPMAHGPTQLTAWVRAIVAYGGLETSNVE